MVVPADDPSCRELVELVCEYLEGALVPGETARFEAHASENTAHASCSSSVSAGAVNARTSPASRRIDLARLKARKDRLVGTQED